ncbi:MAG: cation:proton antiporter [Patescibacteria group bacterium]|nr:MAG: cation:proton antiporter [Patescibacteria group bacterium]
MSHIFLELTLVLALATGFGMLARWLRQPTILGYIATGLIVGPLGLLQLNSPETLDAMAELGITFLLFLVGMEMRFKDLKHVGKAALLTGIGQIVFTFVIGYGLTRLLGYGELAALYIAVALTFSSTIIVVKLLSEKRELESLHGKIVIGFLLVQDFVALLFLILLTSLSGSENATLATLPYAAIGFAFLKGAALLAVSLAIGRWIMPRLLRSVGHSQEVLFLVSMAWGMGMAAVAALPQVGLTIEIGAFLAGIALAGSIERHQITSRIKSLRDFFIVVFFIVLGSKMVLSSAAAVTTPAIVLSLFVLIGNPIIVLVIMGLLGYRSRTSFMASVTVAQISEFSLILMALGSRLGHVNSEVVSLVTVVSIATIAISSYLIIYSETLYGWLKTPLKIFEFRAQKERRPHDEARRGHIVLVGCHRMGHNILASLEEMHKDFTVVDFNPEVVERLAKRGIHAVYGDISDPEIAELCGLDHARLVISTVPPVEDSRAILAYTRKHNPGAKVILTADNEYESLDLYEAGADYVLLPHFIGGIQLARLLEGDTSLSSLVKLREQDIAIITGHP